MSDQLTIKHQRVAALIPYVGNSRTHTDEQVAQIAASIKEFGFTNPVLVDEQNGIIAGHGRLLAARLLQLTDVPTIELSGLSEAQKKAYVIADNQIALNAGWDTKVLALELEGLTDLGFDTDILAFDESFVRGLGGGGKTDDDSVPPLPATPYSKLGDVWECGDHRVMCGNSETAEDLATLMDGELADLVFTDPPYNMDAEGGSAQPIGRAAAKLGDAIKDLTDFEPAVFLELLPTLFPKQKMNAYVFCNKDLLPEYLAWQSASPYSFNLLFWKKPTGIPLGGQHRPDLEYVLFFRKGAVWNNALEDVTYSKCLEYAREGGTEHPTMKPVALIENQVRISSNTGSIVVDPYGGSGSTLIACEKTARLCRTIELDPKYVDVIVTRWQEYTGQVAIHAGTRCVYGAE